MDLDVLYFYQRRVGYKCFKIKGKGGVILVSLMGEEVVFYSN